MYQYSLAETVTYDKYVVFIKYEHTFDVRDTNLGAVADVYILYDVRTVALDNFLYLATSMQWSSRQHGNYQLRI